MTIFIMVLKIIGLILLCLLGLLLLLLLAILFCPIRYRLAGTFSKEKQIQLQIRVHWLLYLVCLSFFRNDAKEQKLTLRILGIPIQLYPKKERTARVKRTRKKKNRTEVPKSGEEPESSLESAVETFAAEESAAEDEFYPESSTTKKKGAALRARLQEIRQRIRSIPERLRAIWNRFQEILHSAEKWKKEISDIGNRKAVKAILREVVYLLRKLAPKQGKADVRFSAGDPALTGEILGGLSMLPLLYKKGVHVVPDFETDSFYILGEIDVRGRFRTYHILKCLIHLYKDDNVKALIKKIR
ncbi:MAG: DUF2953 domain-containing protein [Lachnospiraceae bacterium]|nr:DUF2953 domain-containing protein [Lachnospiraceae bacterium]